MPTPTPTVSPAPTLTLLPGGAPVRVPSPSQREAIEAGVPVVTLVGRRHGERTSYSILANLGVEATVAQTGREYVELAVRLADDAPFAAGVRADSCVIAVPSFSVVVDEPHQASGVSTSEP